MIAAARLCVRGEIRSKIIVMSSGELFESFYEKIKMDYSAAEISVLFSCLEMNCNIHAKKGR